MTTTRPRRVLVVDDDDDLRSAVVEMLADDGWEVHEARHGAEALEVLPQVQPSVMLLDWRMPVMDGGQVLERLGDHRERVRVVLFTASHQVRELATRHQLQFHLGKPFGADELLGVLGRAHAACALGKDEVQHPGA
jgi:CheY-like chemotaxis protein